MKRLGVPVPLAIVGVSTAWQAIGTVVIGEAITPSTSTLSSFIAFGSAALLCSVRSAVAGETPHLLRRAREPRTLVLLLVMNMATAGVFVSFYTALAYLPATSVSVLEAGCAPIVVAVVVMLRQRQRSRGRSLAAPVAVMTLSAIIAWRVIAHEGASTGVLWFGVVLAVVAGVSGASVVLLSGTLSRAEFSPGEVNATRFHLAWVVSGVAYMLTGRDGTQPENLVLLATASVALGAAPLIVLQFGLSRADPLTAELVMSALPALVFITAAVRSGHTDPTIGLLMAGLLLMSLGSVVVEARQERRGALSETSSSTTITEGSP